MSLYTLADVKVAPTNGEFFTEIFTAIHQTYLKITNANIGINFKI